MHNSANPNHDFAEVLAQRLRVPPHKKLIQDVLREFVDKPGNEEWKTFYLQKLQRAVWQYNLYSHVHQVVLMTNLILVLENDMHVDMLLRHPLVADKPDAKTGLFLMAFYADIVSPSSSVLLSYFRDKVPNADERLLRLHGSLAKNICTPS